MRLNVRCCCEPWRILGTLEVPDGDAQAGRTISLHVWPSREAALAYIDSDEPQDAPRIVLTLATYTELLPQHPLAPWPTGPAVRIVGDYFREIAVKAHDVPIETLRRVPGFIETEDA